MKKTVLNLAFMAAMISTAFAQTTVTNNWFIRDQDIIYGATDSNVTSVAITAAGATAQTWDFTTLQPLTKDTFEVFSAASGAAAATFPTATLRIPIMGGDGYLKKTATSVSVIGYSGDPGLGSVISMPFNDPIELQVAPITYGANVTNTSSLRFTINMADYPTIQALVNAQLPAGTAADSIRLTRTSRAVDNSDAFGMVNLPASLSYTAMRVHRMEYNDSKVEIRIALFGGLIHQWIDPSTLSGGTGGAIPGVGKDTVDSYLFISNNERQAVVNITMNRATNQARTIHYLYSPTVVETINAKKASLDLVAQPNPASNEVRIKVGELPMGKNTLRVSNILGKMVYQNTIQANETATLDISRWTNGIYLYSISDEKGNILAGKRLNVVHP
jgi:hypothetical protein